MLIAARMPKAVVPVADWRGNGAETEVATPQRNTRDPGFGIRDSGLGARGHNANVGRVLSDPPVLQDCHMPGGSR